MVANSKTLNVYDLSEQYKYLIVAYSSINYEKSSSEELKKYSFINLKIPFSQVMAHDFNPSTGVGGGGTEAGEVLSSRPPSGLQSEF